MHLPTLLVLSFMFSSLVSEAKINERPVVSRLSQPACGGMKLNDCHDQTGFDEFQDKKRTMPVVERRSRPNRH